MSISSSCVNSNLESHRYRNEIRGWGGSSTTMFTMRLLLFPTMMEPTKIASPFSPGVLNRDRVDMADSMAPWTFFRVPFDLMLAACPCSFWSMERASDTCRSGGMMRVTSSVPNPFISRRSSKASFRRRRRADNFASSAMALPVWLVWGGALQTSLLRSNITVGTAHPRG